MRLYVILLLALHLSGCALVFPNQNKILQIRGVVINELGAPSVKAQIIVWYDPTELQFIAGAGLPALLAIVPAASASTDSEGKFFCKLQSFSKYRIHIYDSSSRRSCDAFVKRRDLGDELRFILK